MNKKCFQANILLTYNIHLSWCAFKLILCIMSSIKHSLPYFCVSICYRELIFIVYLFFRDIEDLWFGPWKHLLLGGLTDHKHIDFLEKKLRKDLKSKCKVDVREDIIKAVIRGGGRQEECLSELIMKKGCHIGGRECINDGSLSSLVSDLLLNAMHEIGEDYVDREPVILVPDFDIQVGNLVMFYPSSLKCCYQKCWANPIWLVLTCT